jgi:hypothetical protein
MRLRRGGGAWRRPHPLASLRSRLALRATQTHPSPPIPRHALATSPLEIFVRLPHINGMSPTVLLFFMSILTPVVIAIVAIAPLYAGFFAALYIVYDKPDIVNPMLAHQWDVFYIIDAYHSLFQYWLVHMESSSFLHFTLPLLGLPLLGLILSMYLTVKMVRFFANYFRMAATH